MKKVVLVAGFVWKSFCSDNLWGEFRFDWLLTGFSNTFMAEEVVLENMRALDGRWAWGCRDLRFSWVMALDR